MHKISTLFNSITQGFRNIFRNRMFSLASIGTMTACLFLFGIFYFVLANVQYMLRTAENAVGITVFFNNGISNDEIEMVGNDILINSNVTSIEYLSAENTWKEYKEKFLTDEVAKSFGDDNPLEDSASYTVYTKDVSKQAGVAEYIRGIPGVRQVNHSETITEGLSGLNRVVGYVSGVIIVLLLCVATFLIGTTISMGISVRKQEISIMKLIGATDFFIRGPFIVEGVLLGLIGAAIPIVFLYGCYYKILDYVMNRFSSVFAQMKFVDANTIFAALIPVSLLIGLGIGFLGSYITLSRELHKID